MVPLCSTIFTYIPHLLAHVHPFIRHHALHRAHCLFSHCRSNTGCCCPRLFISYPHLPMTRRPLLADSLRLLRFSLTLGPKISVWFFNIRPVFGFSLQQYPTSWHHKSTTYRWITNYKSQQLTHQMCAISDSVVLESKELWLGDVGSEYLRVW